MKSVESQHFESLTLQIPILNLILGLSPFAWEFLAVDFNNQPTEPSTQNRLWKTRSDTRAETSGRVLSMLAKSVGHRGNTHSLAFADFLQTQFTLDVDSSDGLNTSFVSLAQQTDTLADWTRSILAVESLGERLGVIARARCLTALG